MYKYKAKVIKVVDGDTIDCNVDLGFHMTAKIRFRLAKINTPEVRGIEKKEGLAAKEWLINFLEQIDYNIIVKTKKTGKYGRWIGHLYVNEDDVDSISDELVKAGHAEYVNY